jgi:hypothetical protein
MPLNEMPMGLSLLICDLVIQDKQTNKRTLVGLFDRLFTTKLPCMHPSLTLFVSLTSGHGQYKCEIVCRHQKSNEIAFKVKGTVGFQNPLQVVELVFNVQGITFRNEGEYWVEFKVDEVPVMMRRIFIVLKQTKSSQPGN